MRPGPYLVGIAGGSGSGKTALAGAVASALAPLGVARLSQDAYYRDLEGLTAAQRSALNFDVPDALDLDLFVEHLAALRRGQPVRPPSYCFVTHRRRGHDAAIPGADVLLVEGILVLHDARVRALLDLRIYLDAPTDVRMARRLARDTRERGRTTQSVIAQCQTFTLSAHARYVEPSRAWADVVLVNASRLEPVAEVAATLIRTHRARRSDDVHAVKSA